MRKSGSRLTNRIQEFELWRKDSDFFKDGEYAKRRAQRRDRLNVLESDQRLKKWKKVYIPAMLGMIIGTFFTLASTIHGLGKNTIFWSSKEVFHVLGPVFLCVGLFFLVIAAACSHREEEKLRMKLGLPSMFPQRTSMMKTLPSEELTSITTVSEMDSSHSLSEKFASKSKDRNCLRINSGNLSPDYLEAASFLEVNPPISKSSHRSTDSQELKYTSGGSRTAGKRNTRNITFSSGCSIASESVFERENEMRRMDLSSLQETDIDAYCAMEEKRIILDIETASSCINSDSLRNMLKHHDMTTKTEEESSHGITKETYQHLESKSQTHLKSREWGSHSEEIELNMSEAKKDRSRIVAFHRLAKTNNKCLSSASETSSGYSSGTNMVETEQFEVFASFDSE